MARDYFNTTQQDLIIQAIKSAELNTSGEIRVHLEKKCSKDPIERAKEVFYELKMNETELQNGVLFYLALNDRKFAILGDKGIDQKTPSDFWDDIKAHMLEHLKKEQYLEALTEGIELAGNALKQHFPYQSDDINELSDEISFNDE